MIIIYNVEEHMNKATKILIGVITFVLVLGSALGFYYVKAYSNPFNRTAIAVKKTMGEKSQDTSVIVNFSLVPEKMGETLGYELTEDEKSGINYINSLLSKTAITMNMKQETNKKNPFNSKIQYSMGLLYDQEYLVDFLFGMNQEYLEILIPTYLNKTFFISKDDIYKKLELDLEDFNFEKYFKIIEKNKKQLNKLDKDQYENLIKENFEKRIKKGKTVKIEISNGKSIKCKEYILKMKFKDMIYFMNDLKAVLEKDKIIREYTRTSALAIAEELYDSKDYQAFNLDKEDMKEIVDILDNKNDFKDLYEEMMDSLDELFYDLENIQDEINLDYNITYAIDWKNNIRAMGMDMDYEFMHANYQYIFNSVGKPVRFNEFKDNERIDVIEIMDQEDDELYGLFEDMLVDAGDKIISNKALESLIRDIKENSELLPYEYSEMLKEWIAEFDQDKEAFFDNIVDELLYELQYLFSFGF